MPIDAEQRDSLRLELLTRSNERDKWINDYYRGLDAELERARTRVRDCIAYTDIGESERLLVTREMWDSRKVERKVYNDGSVIVHELDIRVILNGAPCRRLMEAERETSVIEKRIAAKPPFIRQWQTERDLLRALARDVEMGRLGQLTSAQIEERCEKEGGT